MLLNRARQLLNHKWIEWSIICSMILVMSMIFFTPDYAIIRKLTAHAFEAVILFLVSAMVFMVLKSPRVMFTCLGICAILCLYLKQKSNSGIKSLFNISSPDFSICQVLISGGSDQYEMVSKSLLNSKADIISIQEVTPDWAIVLNDALSEVYTYEAMLSRIDPYGMVIYSKFPIKKVDTLMSVDTSGAMLIPALKLSLDVNGHQLEFIGCHVLPRLSVGDFEKVQGFFNMISQNAQSNIGENIMISGDLGVTPWDGVLQSLIQSSGLTLSRREPHLFVQPFEHILYSSDITCNQLREVLTPERFHLGIQGYYVFAKTQ
ncbi:MAG: endonuclease/exonuclease/phosphatase family protein [Saprospiraceae bacterium]|nr:endonuclease/exonuclease/phosphatase family protein [Saprospiraceae bacterium]MBP8094049.1 endonuclease/exonuclease/phosphatase family protein [Saprospiraceae bacterium]